MATLTRMYQRRGTAAQWANVANSVRLQAGEIGLETDTGKFKIGDGNAVWSALSYYLKDSDNSSLYVKLNPIAPGYNQTITGINLFVPQSSSQTPLVVSGVSGQSAVLQRWRSNTDVTLASIDQAGKLMATGALFNAEVNVNNNKIVNLALPTEPKDAANKEYVDEIAQGLSVKPAVQAATTENLVGTYANGTSGVGATLNIGPATELDIDGWTTWAIEDGVLVKDQTNKAHNGRYYIYQVGDVDTDWILIRCTACDEQDEIPSAYVFVQHGDTYASTGWVAAVEDLATFEVGVDDITWVQFSGAGTFTAGDGLILDGPEFNVVGTANRITANADSIDIASTYVGQTSITTLGTVTTGTWSASTIAADKGGTGQTSYAVGDILYASTSSALSKLAAGTANQVLLSNGSATAPSWGQVVTASLQNSSSTITGVTYAKLQYVSAQWRVLGRKTSAAGVVEEMAPNDIISMIGQGTTSISISRIPTGTTSSTVALGDHTHTLDQLSDVVITAPPVARQVLKYDGTNWINELPSGGVSVGATPPTQPTSGDAWFDSTDGSLYVYYDDGVGETSTNYVVNPTFGGPGDGLNDWTISGGSAARTTSEAYSGTTSMQVGNSSFQTANLTTQDFINITAGQTYTASAWIKKSSSGNPASIQIQHFDSSNTLLDTIFSFGFSTSTTNWQRISVTKTFEAPTAKVKIRVNVGDAMSGTSNVFVDAVQFELGSSASEYFDGSLAGSSWTGTAHASTSTNPSGGNTAQWVQVKANSALEASILTRVSALESQQTNGAYNIIAPKTASYTVGNGDQNDLIQMNSGSALNLLIPTDATNNFPIGTKIEIIQIGTGQVTIAAVTPGTTTVNGTPGLKLRAQWSHAAIIKRAANTWVAIGDLAA